MKRYLSLLIALVLTMSLCVGITMAAAEGDPVTIQLAYPGGPEEFALFQAAIDAHKEQLEGIEVEVIHIPAGEYWNKVTTMFAGSAAPDLTFMSEPFPMFASKGQLADLTPYADKFKLDEWFPVGLDFYTWDGKLMGLPKDLNAWVMFFNKDLFAEAGLKNPVELFEAGEWTFDAYLEAAKALTVRDGDAITQYGTAFNGLNGWTSAAWFYAGGAQFLNEDRTECLLGSDEATYVFQFLTDLAFKDQVAPNPMSEGATGAAALTGVSFETGKIAMQATGSWNIPAYADVEFAWDIAPMPVVPGINPYTSYAHLSGFSMAEASPNKDAAAEVLAILTGEEFQTTLAGMGIGSVPPRVQVAQSDTYKNAVGMPEHAHYITDILDKGAITYPFTVVDGDLDRVYKEYTDKMNVADSDVPALAAEMVQEANFVLEDLD